MFDALWGWLDKKRYGHLDRKLNRKDKSYISTEVKIYLWATMVENITKEYNRRINELYILDNGRKAYDAATRS